MEIQAVKRDYEFYRLLPPEQYPQELKLWFQSKTGAELDLEHPQTFNEKIQWLKLYDSTPLKTRLADKYLVREWVKEKVGDTYLIPLLGVWDRFDEIDFDALPNSFVLKANHGSNWNVIVKDKALLDINAAKYNFDYWLKSNFALQSLEFHYADIKPKIIAEEYMADLSGAIMDYRFFCFNGVPKYVWVDLGSGTPAHTRNIYDMDFNLLDTRVNYPPIVPTPTKPDNFEEMAQLATCFCAGFAFVRIDFYSLKNKIYFGEMTFTPQSGIGIWDPPDQNLVYGSLLTLPTLKYPLPDRSFAERGVEPRPDDFHKRETNIRVQLQKTEAARSELYTKLQEANAAKAEIYAKLRQAYETNTKYNVRVKQLSADKDDLNAKLKQANAAKAEIYAKLRQAYETNTKYNVRVKQLSEDKNDLNAKLKQAYSENSELSAKLKQTYTEKSHLNAKLQQTYAEKSARGVQIRELKQQIRKLKENNGTLKEANKRLQQKNRKLKRSYSYRLGRILTWPVRRLKALFSRK